MLELLLGGRLGRNAVFGDLFVSDPANGIENYFPEIVVLPIVVPVTSCEAEAAAAVVVLGNPHDVLEVASLDGGSRVGRGIVMVIPLGQQVDWRHC